MVKDAETKSEMLVAVVALVILPRKYGVVKCSTDPRGRGGHKESASLKNGFLGLEYGHKKSASLKNGFIGLEYLLQLRGNRSATAWKDLVVFPVVSVYNSDQTHLLRRLASFAKCSSDRLPPDCPWVSRLVSSGYFYDEAAQTILCFACGRPYPSHVPDCDQEHENVTSFPVPPPLPVGPDGDVADVGRMNVQVQTSREGLRLLLNDNMSARAVPETGSEGGDARASTSAGDASGQIENQMLTPFAHGEDALLHPVMDSNRPMSILANRMATYTRNWNGPSVREMAECGLYQVSDDRAKCFSCRTVFRGLTEETCIWDHHYQLAPDCPHLLHARRFN